MSFCLQILVVLTLSFNFCWSTSNYCFEDVNIYPNLYSEGFHRLLNYKITFKNVSAPKCLFAVKQNIPPGVFVNPEELDDLRRLGTINAFSQSKVNVELPAERSGPSTAYMVNKGTEDRVSLWLPMHARYHRARPGGGKVENVIVLPTLYVRCPGEQIDNCPNIKKTHIRFLCKDDADDACDWRQMSYNAVKDGLVWSVPIGDTRHRFIVSFCTAAAVIIGSFYLLYVIIENRPRPSKMKRH